MKSGNVYFEAIDQCFIILLNDVKEGYYANSFTAIEVIDGKIREVRLKYNYIKVYGKQIEEPMADLIRTLYL